VKPNNFLSQPMSSIQNKSEAETVARNIMVILSATGNRFRRLSWEEYKSARLRDGSFTEAEQVYFEKVWPYTVSAEKAAMFSPVWGRAGSAAEEAGGMSDKTPPKLTHTYVGRDKGGCVVMLISDQGDEWTGQVVGEAIADGLTIERVDWETYVNVISKEPTFMKCNCEPEPGVQPALF
jgi:hypothetical protein